MSAVVEKLSSNKVKLTVTVSAQDFDRAMSVAYNKLKGRLSVPGFRKGKAPRKVIENYYGAGVLVEEAFNEVLPGAYDAAVEEQDIQPVAQPDIDIQSVGAGEDCVFTALVFVRPDVTLGQYKGIVAPAAQWSVEDEQVDAEVDKALERVSRMVDIEDRACEMGDTVNINYAGTVDGVPFQGGTSEDMPLQLGSGTFIPGFEEQVVGMNVGAEGDINVKFPEDYRATELAGKDAVFHIVVNSIKHKELPELNDEFASEISDFETMDAYKADIKAKLEETAKTAAENARLDALIDEVSKNAVVDIPDAMIERQIDQMVRDMGMRMSQQGLRMEDFLMYTGQTMEQMRATHKEQAQKQVLAELVLDAVVKAEGISVADEEVDAEIEKYGLGADKSLEDIKKTLSDVDMEYFRVMVKTQKAVNLIRDSSVLA